MHIVMESGLLGGWRKDASGWLVSMRRCQDASNEEYPQCNGQGAGDEDGRKSGRVL